jgi:hypothetical protein
MNWLDADQPPRRDGCLCKITLYSVGMSGQDLSEIIGYHRNRSNATAETETGINGLNQG